MTRLHTSTHRAAGRANYETPHAARIPLNTLTPCNREIDPQIGGAFADSEPLSDWLTTAAPVVLNITYTNPPGCLDST